MIGSLVLCGARACLLAGVVLIVNLAAKRLSPAARAWLWWIVLAEFALGWIGAIPISLAAPSFGHLKSGALPLESIASSGPLLDVGRPLPGDVHPSWVIGVIGVFWALGCAAAFLRILLSTLRLFKLSSKAMTAPESLQARTRALAAELGVSRPPELKVSESISSPAVFGLLRQMILLPPSFTELDRDEQEMALVHELEHIRRRDGTLALIPRAATSIFWFLPVVYATAREWSLQRELACDEAVLSRPAAQPGAYRHLLLRMIEQDSKPLPAPALGVTADFRTLKRRLLATTPLRHRPHLGVACISLAIVAGVPFSFMRAVKGNVLINPGFELGSDGWSRGRPIQGVEYLVDTGISHSGQMSIGIRKSATRFFPIAKWTQAIPYDGRYTAFEFGGWMKAENASKAVLDVEFSAGAKVLRHRWVAYIGAQRAGDPPITQDWTRLGGIVDIPAGTTEIDVSLQDYGPGQVWLDDASARFLNEPNN